MKLYYNDQEIGTFLTETGSCQIEENLRNELMEENNSIDIVYDSNTYIVIENYIDSETEIKSDRALLRKRYRESIEE